MSSVKLTVYVSSRGAQHFVGIGDGVHDGMYASSDKSQGDAALKFIKMLNKDGQYGVVDMSQAGATTPVKSTSDTYEEEFKDLVRRLSEDVAERLFWIRDDGLIRLTFHNPVQSCSDERITLTGVETFLVDDVVMFRLIGEDDISEEILSKDGFHPLDLAYVLQQLERKEYEFQILADNGN